MLTPGTSLRLGQASQLLNLCCSLFLTDIAYQNSSFDPATSKPLSTLTNLECRRVLDRNGYPRTLDTTTAFEFDDIDHLDPSTRVCLPRVSSCCFLQIIDIEFDAFTSRPHYIYEPNPNISTLLVPKLTQLRLSQLREEYARWETCPPNPDSASSINGDDYPQEGGSEEDGESDDDDVPENCIPPIEEIPFLAPIWYLREPWEIAVKTCATVPIAIVAIIGNSAVIRIILKNKLTRNSVNQFILNMSIADLLNALIYPWIFLATDFYQSFQLGKVICEYHSTLLNTLMLTSIFSLCAISFDRLTAVVFPFRKKMSPRTAKYVIYAIWVASIAITAPLVLWREYMDRQWLDFREIWCNEDRSKSRLYWLLLISILFWIPVGVMVVSYTGIIIKLHFLEKKQREDHGHKSQIQAKSKVIWMFFLVLIAFIICWTPFTVVVYVRDKLIADKISYTVPEWVDDLLFASQVLMITNSAVNPIIYGFKNENLRRGFRSVVPSCCKRQSKIEVSTIMADKMPRRRPPVWGSSSPRPDPSAPTPSGPQEDIFNSAMKNARHNVWPDQPPPYNPGHVDPAPPMAHAGRGSAGSLALQILAKTKKYYESILFANNSCTEKASLNSYERRDSALADLGLPIPGSPPFSSSGSASGCNSGCTASSNSPTASTTVEHI